MYNAIIIIYIRKSNSYPLRIESCHVRDWDYAREANTPLALFPLIDSDSQTVLPLILRGYLSPVKTGAQIRYSWIENHLEVTRKGNVK